MKTIRLDSNLVDAFRGLDPFETLDMLAMRGCFALGTVTDFDEGVNEPAALLVAMIEDDRLVIHWLFVRPEYREMGMGSYLMLLAFEEADRRNLSQVVARISDEYDRDDPDFNSWDFFANDIFKGVEEGECVWRVPMSKLSKMLAKDTVLNERVIATPGLIRMKDMSVADRNAAIKNIKTHFAVNMEIPLEDLLKTADPEMSFFRKKKDGYVGMILVRKSTNTRYFYEIDALDETDEELLLRASLYYSEDFVKMTENIEIGIKKKSFESLLEEIKLPGEKYAVNYLTASIKDFRKMKKQRAEMF